VCWQIKTRLESGPFTADLTTTVVHRSKLLINDVKPDHSFYFHLFFMRRECVLSRFIYFIFKESSSGAGSGISGGANLEFVFLDHKSFFLKSFHINTPPPVDRVREVDFFMIFKGEKIKW